MHPGKFSYVINKDAGSTSNLNVWIQSGTDDTREQVHNKVGGQEFPNKDWAGFDERLNQAMSKL